MYSVLWENGLSFFSLTENEFQSVAEVEYNRDVNTVTNSLTIGVLQLLLTNLS